MVKKIFFFCLLIVASFRCMAQVTDGFNYLLHTDTINLSLNCNKENCEAFFNNAILFKNLKTLKIKNPPRNLNFRALSFLPDLETLEIEYAYKLNIRSLGRSLSKCNALRHLDLSDNRIKGVPASFRKLKKLQYINLSDNPKFREGKSYRTLAKLPQLDSLDISGNRVKRINKSIDRFVELDFLDIGYTSVTDGLFLWDRIYIPPRKLNLKVNTLKLNNEYDNSIFYYCYEVGLVPEKKLILDYSEVDYDIYMYMFRRSRYRFFSVDTNVYSVTDNISDEENGEGKKYYGEFNTGKATVKVLSTAYTHYDRFLKQDPYTEILDTTLFADRYKDLRYTGTSFSGFQLKPSEKIPRRFMTKARIKKMQKRYQCTIYPVGEKIKNELFLRGFGKFRFLGNKNFSLPADIALSYPELNAFAGSRIRLHETGSKSLLNRCWTDIRFDYDAGSDQFTIELKSPEGFETFKADLVRYDTIKIEERNKKIFEAYKKLLRRKENNFNRKIPLQVHRFERKKINAERQAWKNFKKKYMPTAGERAMSHSDWEIYYNSVMDNETEALYNSDITVDVFKRALEVKGLKELNPFDWHVKEKNMEVRCAFQDKGEKIADPQRIVIIDKEKGIFTCFNGHTTASLNIFFVPADPKRKYDLFIETERGKYALVRNVQFGWVDENTTFSQNVLFTMDVLPAELSDIRLVMRKLNY